MGSSPIVSTARVQVRAYRLAPAAAHGARRAIRVPLPCLDMPLPCRNGSVSVRDLRFLHLCHAHEHVSRRAAVRDRYASSVDNRGAGDALEAFFGIGDSGTNKPFDIKQIRLARG